MARTPSTMQMAPGTEAPDFALPDYNAATADSPGQVVSRDEVSEENGLLVMFICNHCPFVKHIRAELAEIGRFCADRAVGVVAIMPNDVANHPDDAPAKMTEEARAAGYDFPYLYDESQEVAKAYHAACTPDFFLFDADLRLAYRGQLDDSRPGSETPVTGADLRAAIEAVSHGRSPSGDQKPSIGCNIKWIKGREPAYFSH
ncbi:MAG: thioredoxin family protein [Phycisphaerales bacterium]